MKTETKATPGPWHHHDMEEMTVCGPDNLCVARTDAKGRSLDKNEANAHLIAAAPSLLAAAEAWEACFKNHEGEIFGEGLPAQIAVGDAIELTKAAITKAGA